MDTELILYGTTACHLCEEAESLLQFLHDITWRHIDIADNDALFDQYGLRIPVLVRPDGHELGWPFDAAMIAAFIRK